MAVQPKMVGCIWLTCNVQSLLAEVSELLGLFSKLSFCATWLLSVYTIEIISAEQFEYIW